ncbi:MAG: DUF5615 family PIN-like protein [bacterium]
MNIRFLLDENMPYALIALIEKRGFLVEHLKKIGKSGIKNGEVYKLAEEKKDMDYHKRCRFSKLL